MTSVISLSDFKNDNLTKFVVLVFELIRIKTTHHLMALVKMC